METGPRTWTLAVPLTRPPVEQRVVRLQGRRSARGTGMARQDLARGAAGPVPGDHPLLSGAAEEVVRMLAEIRREDALPGDTAGLTRRFAAEAGRLDLYYRFEFGIAAGRTR